MSGRARSIDDARLDGEPEISPPVVIELTCVQRGDRGCISTIRKQHGHKAKETGRDRGHQLLVMRRAAQHPRLGLGIRKRHRQWLIRPRGKEIEMDGGALQSPREPGMCPPSFPPLPEPCRSCSCEPNAAGRSSWHRESQFRVPDLT